METHHSNALDALLASIAAKSEQFAAKLAAMPSERPCSVHPDRMATLNEEASYAAGNAVYRCPECVTTSAAAKRERRMMAAGIPSDVRHATLLNFQTSRATVKLEQGFVTPETFLQNALKFSKGEIRNLLLCGTPGIGKGHLAAALAIDAIDSGESVAWIDCASLFSAYHRAYSENRTEAVLAPYATASLLVLDEVCLRDLPADGEEILFAIFDRRHKAALPSVLLGNAIAAKARTWLGGRIVDRLRTGGVAFCYGEWQSMRGNGDDGKF